MRAIVHLVIGSTGAGKSTFARKLADDTQSVRFTMDEWMVRLYRDDKPEDANAHWFMERIARITEQIWEMTLQLHARGTSVVLEIGLTQKIDRETFYTRIREADIPLRLYMVDATPEVRWARVEARNQAQGETYSLQVTRGMFEFVEGMWEPPAADELSTWSGVIINTDGEP